jgi:cytoskeleton protein RodZ
MSGGDNSAHTGSKIGRTLELARKERGLSLKQVEEATKIRAAYLAELERENFGVLPAVYVQGSLKTYANFLQLDGEEMVRELKRRQAPREEPSYPLHVSPREDDSLDDALVAIGGAAGVGPQDEAEHETEDEAEARPALLPAGITTYLYLGSAVVLVVAAAALALTMVGDGKPAVSQVRKPLISQAPETSPPDIAQEDARPQQPSQGDEQRAGDEDNQSEEADQRSQPQEGQGDTSQADSSQAQEVSASARASASAVAETESAPATPEPGAASSLEAREEPDEGSPLSVGTPATAPQSGPAPASSSLATGGPTRQPTATPTGAAPSGGSTNPPAQDAGGLKVRVGVGSDDVVQITGGPFED